jgi:hypothetical protein
LEQQVQQMGVQEAPPLSALTPLLQAVVRQAERGPALALKQLLATWEEAATEQQALLLTAQKPVADRRLLGLVELTQAMEPVAEAVAVEIA